MANNGSGTTPTKRGGNGGTPPNATMNDLFEQLGEDVREALNRDLEKRDKAIAAVTTDVNGMRSDLAGLHKEVDRIFAHPPLPPSVRGAFKRGLKGK